MGRTDSVLATPNLLAVVSLVYIRSIVLVESDLGHTTLCRVISVTNTTFTNTLLNYNRMAIVVLDEDKKKK